MPEKEKKSFPKQKQKEKPGKTSKMKPEPVHERREGMGCGKLKDKVAIITGGDSGIGRAVAVAFAQEGADISIVYYNEHEDARAAQKDVEEKGRRCILISGDIGEDSFCQEAVEKTIEEFGHLDILVNNAAEQHPQKSLEDISTDQLVRTFKTNIFGMFHMTKAALKHLKKGSSIICTTSVNAYRGNPSLIDYSSTKGAIVGFIRSLSLNLAEKEIRVNGVAPGPIWTPLIPSTFSPEKTSEFGENKPMERAGQPVEVAPSFVFLASEDASYFSGQVLHPNGGEVVNG
jgi:NAD(P)-dependent dehydrogenase (short-subunit alcohol dehydrogenase family)